MKAGYFHAIGGASGDMILGALVDAGLSLEALKAKLAHLPLSGYSLSAQKAFRGPIQGTQVLVTTQKAYPGLRSLTGILKVIQGSSLPDRVKEKGEAIFRRLAQAEGKVHGVAPERVRFHDLGVMDTVIDIMGAVIGLEILGLDALYSSPLPAGSGTIETPYGIYPLPAPATMELMALAGAPVSSRVVEEGEQTTPTGAAILSTLARFHLPSLRLERIGYGVGSREMARLPNVLALWLGQTEGDGDGERELLLVETNIDNMNPELAGYVMERLLGLGALDVWFTPIQMKKNRPAITLSALCPLELEAEVVKAIIQETPTLGMRLQPVRRLEVSRRVVEFVSSLGTVKIKLKEFQGQTLGLAPEFEDCRRLAQEHARPLPQVYSQVVAEASARLLPLRTGGNK